MAGCQDTKEPVSSHTTSHFLVIMDLLPPAPCKQCIGDLNFRYIARFLDSWTSIRRIRDIELANLHRKTDLRWCRTCLDSLLSAPFSPARRPGPSLIRLKRMSQSILPFGARHSACLPPGTILASSAHYNPRFTPSL